MRQTRTLFCNMKDTGSTKNHAEQSDMRLLFLRLGRFESYFKKILIFRADELDSFYFPKEPRLV